MRSGPTGAGGGASARLAAGRIQGRVVSEGEGHSKKEAQQEAARRALESLEAEAL